MGLFVPGLHPSRSPPAALLVSVVVVLLLGGCSPNVEHLRSRRDVEGLIEVLGYQQSSEVRADAAEALGGLGDARALEALAGALDDEVGSVRRAAAAALGAIESPRALEPLLAALTDPDPTVREAAAEALGRLGQQQAVMPLLAALEDASPAVRDAAQRAVRAVLADVGERGPRVLIAALDHELPGVRAAAAAALGDFGQQQAVVPLLIALEDPSPPVRAAAERALGSLLAALRDDGAAAGLVRGLGHELPAVRARAAEALGDFGQQQAVVPLLIALEDPSPPVRAAAERALGSLLAALGDGEAVVALVSGVGHRLASVREASERHLRQLLAGIEPQRAAEALIEAGANDVLLAHALGVPEHRLAAETRVRGLELEDSHSILTALSSLREGVPAPEAHPYEPSEEFHPAVVFGPPDLNPPEWAREAQARWAPTALRFAELVIIEDDNSEVLEVCSYHGPSITRYRPVQTLQVLSAHDGRVIAERSFRGSAPRQCGQSEPYHLTELYGEPADLAAEAVPWLQSLVHPPA